MKPIDIYTREEAIEDGILQHLEEHFSSEEIPATCREELGQLKNKPGKFPLGELIITTNAADKLEPSDILQSLTRHQNGDWGDVGEHDAQMNQEALRYGDRLFSVYYATNGTRLWIITEASREATTVMLPGDY